MAKVVRYLTTYYVGGVPKYVAGEDYPLNEETRSHIAGQYAEIVETKSKKASADPVPGLDLDPPAPVDEVPQAVQTTSAELVAELKVESTAGSEPLIDNTAADNKAN